MKPRRTLTFWNYWLAWISVNALAWTVGFGMAQLYSRILYPNDSFIQSILEDVNYIWTRPLDSPVATANYGLMLGAAVGLGQWYLLRRRFDIKLLWWLVATMFGFAVHGLLLGLDIRFLSGGQGVGQIGLAGELTQGEALRSLGLLGSGVLLVGILQWLVLRQHLPKAAWWILASALGLVVAAIDRTGGTSRLLGWILVSLGAGAAYGIVTAFFLFFMMPAKAPVMEDMEET
jgi:hypothetical protein